MHTLTCYTCTLIKKGNNSFYQIKFESNNTITRFVLAALIIVNSYPTKELYFELMGYKSFNIVDAVKFVCGSKISG